MHPSDCLNEEVVRDSTLRELEWDLEQEHMQQGQSLMNVVNQVLGLQSSR